MLDRRGADKSVVHGSASDAEPAQPGKQLGGCLIAEETRCWKVVRDQLGNRDRTPSCWRRQPGKDGERLERGVSRQAEHPVTDCVDNCAVMLVIGHYEWNGGTGVDQRLRFGTCPLSGGRRHEALAPVRRQW